MSVMGHNRTCEEAQEGADGGFGAGSDTFALELQRVGFTLQCVVASVR